MNKTAEEIIKDASDKAKKIQAFIESISPELGTDIIAAYMFAAALAADMTNYINHEGKAPSDDIQNTLNAAATLFSAFAVATAKKREANNPFVTKNVHMA